MSSTMVLLKPEAQDFVWLLRQSSSCVVMNETKFAHVLSVSGFLPQVVSVLLKIPDTCTFL